MLFEKQVNRKPNKYPWANEFMKSFWTSFWTPEKFNFQSDYNDFKVNMSKEEQEVITKAISAISQIEVAVKTFWGDLGKNLPHPIMADLGYCLANTETVHNLSYEKLLDTLELEDEFLLLLEHPVMKNRVEYLRKHVEKVSDDPKRQYVYSIILFSTLIENVSLFSQFYIVKYFNRYKNVLKDTSQQVDFTLSEETLHAQVGFKIINTLRKEYPEIFDDEMENLIVPRLEKALEYEHKMIDWILEDFEGDQYLNAPVLKNYITNRMNESFRSIGYSDVQFPVNNTLLELSAWMNEEQFGSSHTDFFVKNPTTYSKSSQPSELSFEDLF